MSNNAPLFKEIAAALLANGPSVTHDPEGDMAAHSAAAGAVPCINSELLGERGGVGGGRGKRKMGIGAGMRVVVVEGTGECGEGLCWGMEDGVDSCVSGGGGGGGGGGNFLTYVRSPH